MVNSQKKVLLILPHWRIEGGAGYYIRDLISILRKIGTVNVAGPYANDYEKDPIKSEDLEKLNLLILPTYEGVNILSIIYSIVLSIFRAVSILAMPRSKKFKEHFDILFLTSSIQAMALPIARWIFPKCRIAIVVQENVCLSQGFGRLTKYLLKQANFVISITEIWAEHAKNNGIDSILLPNNYDIDYAAPELNTAIAIYSDILYVGGGAKIKGFENLTSVLPMLLKDPGRRSICLGYYDEYSRKTLESIRAEANDSSQLEIVGLVSDIRPYLRGTKVLLLPIGSPHFCRPAVEAGLFYKPFIISRFDGVREFAFDDINCKMYENNNEHQLYKIVSEILNSPDTLLRLGCENNLVALRYQRSREFAVNAMLKILKSNV